MQCSAAWPPSMNSSASGVHHQEATVDDRPTTAVTTSSRPASCIVRRKNGNVSMRPVAGSTSSASCHSQPGWFSSEPRWWSTVTTCPRADCAAAPSQVADFPQYVPTSSNNPCGAIDKAGSCDREQRLCCALSFWNGRDLFLKERAFGLTNPEGNHGEDVKDYWWYVDATPTASWLRWRYHYPQQAFPYDQLREENARRGRDQPEFELLDTGIFD